MSLTIVPTFDHSVTSSAEAKVYEAAVDTAINFFEQHFTNVNNVTVNLTFSFRSNSYMNGAVGENLSQYSSYTYGQVYGAIQTVDGAPSATATQREAATSLSQFGSADPTGGGNFWLTTADARALGLVAPASSATSPDATVMLNSGDLYSWSQSGGIAAGTFDAVGTFEHEISETLGRTAFLGQNIFGDGADYNILDLFHYGAAGQLAEPFNSTAFNSYTAGGSAYFSLDGGLTHGLTFSSWSEVSAGNDVADWSSNVSNDSFGYATLGMVDAVSPTDMQVLNVLGYAETSSACYCAGTRIATAQGEVAVEDLRIGDLVLTASGALRPLKWIGTRAYSARFARNNPDLLPIRFKAGSLAENAPARDLLVSPKHAMFLDSVLIPAERLVNGATIVKESPGEDIHYYHLELDSHDVLIAEGAFSESFVDDDSRGMFQNAHEFRKLYPDEKSREAVYCAPRVEDGFALDRVRRRLAERAGLAFPAATDFGALLGAIEACDREGVSGWALSTAFRNAPVCLDVIVDGAFIDHAYAEAARKKGGWRFDLRFPAVLDPSRPHEIELRRSADGARLGRLVLSEAQAASRAG